MSTPSRLAATSWIWRQVVSVPRVADADDPRGWMTASVAPAVTAAHADLRSAARNGPATDAARTGGHDDQSSALAVSWLRLPDSTDVRVVVGGTPALPLARDDAQVAPARTRRRPTSTTPGMSDP